MAVTETKAFNSTNQWVIALLVGSVVGVAALALYWGSFIGWDKASAMVWTVLGVFLTAIGMQTNNKIWLGALALAGILLASYAYIDGLVTAKEQANCGVSEVAPTKAN